MRTPELFSREINNEVLGTGKFSHVLSAAIRALPYISEVQLRDELKRALCNLLLPKHGAA
jgi:hypothetical protein